MTQRQTRQPDPTRPPLPPPVVPPQWRGTEPAPWPQHPAPRRARRLPPYPAHRVRFPVDALAGGSGGRGPSLYRVIYLGRHPVALLIGLGIGLAVTGIIAAWTLLLVAGWALWASAVTAWWLCRLAAAAVRR